MPLSDLEDVRNYIAFALSMNNVELESSMLWISIKANLLLNRPKALQNLENFLTDFVSSTEVASHHLTEIFDFDSPGYNPLKNRYTVSILWRQRILCQFIPIYVKHFSQLSPDDHLHRNAFLELLSPLLENAQKLTVPLSTELLQILPILSEALELLAEADSQSPLLDVVVESFIQLLKQASLASVPSNEIDRNLRSLQKILSKEKSKMVRVLTNY